MASFPAGTTLFFLEIESALGSFVQEIPRSLNDAADQQHAPSLPFRSVLPNVRNYVFY
jgi:hypothetical protein